LTKPTKTVYLTIHGHFYQPPRENPWIERIELQPDASPFHDWNDRISIQCYQPNAMSRIVDSHGKVLEMVNNFRLLNFNIGPTLFDWFEKHAPIVYRRILEGDRMSVRDHSGHGNALAQVYNHMILPLAQEREQRTQIRWGVYEFKKRFGRDPEGIWLSETAANERTLEILIEEGIKFTILSPEQAATIRPLEVDPEKGLRRPGHGPWEEVPHGTIDPTRPYRFFHPKDPNRGIDLFFFHGPLSREVSFGDVLFDGKKFIEKLLAAHRPERQHPELIHIAVDGETFGHHKAFGERVVTYLLHEAAEPHGFKKINYSEYLEKFPPQYEVKLQPGEGTSWSCAHGVGRWQDDCGCHTGGQAGWNQKWRRPLREAVRHLEEAVAKLYEENGRPLFQDPWQARDGYIEVILDRSPENREKFLAKYASRTLSPEDKIKAIKLLEMAKYAMLTETSCGWFFNDLSGIETLQILSYALRAIELAEELGAGALEKEFVDLLAHAKSNRREIGDGRDVWEKLVKPGRVSLKRIVSHFAFFKLFGLEAPPDDFYGYQIQEGESEQETVEDMTLLMGTVRLTGKTIPETYEFTYAIFQEKIYGIQCFAKRSARPDELHRLDVAPLPHLRKKFSWALLNSLRQAFGVESFSLKDLFPEEREKILWVLTRDMREDLYQTATRFSEERHSEVQLFHEAGNPLPEEIRGLLEWMMGERLFQLVQKLDTPTASFEDVANKAKALFAEANSRGFSIKTNLTVDFLSAKLNAWIEKLFQEPDASLVQRIEKALELARELNIHVRDRIAQDLFFVFAQRVLREWIEAYQQMPGEDSKLEMIQTVIRLGIQLGFNMRPYEDRLKLKATV